MSTRTTPVPATPDQLDLVRRIVAHLIASGHATVHEPNLLDTVIDRLTATGAQHVIGSYARGSLCRPLPAERPVP